MYSDIKGAQPSESTDGDSGDIYWRNELKGKITFKPVKIYNIGFSWGIKTLFEVYFIPTLYKFPYASADDQEEWYI